MKVKNKVNDILKPYIQTKSSEYSLNINGTQMYPGVIFADREIPKIKKRGYEISLMDSKFMDSTNPDVVDSVEFWKKSVSAFPLFAICGNPDCQSIDDVNDRTLGYHSTPLDYLIDNKLLPEDKTMLEIGPGYGGFLSLIESRFPFAQYHCIDVNPLFHHKNMHQCDGRTIPDNIPDKLDYIHSVNVFQHLSQSQRDSYYRQAFDRLKSGGIFVFGTYCKSRNNSKYFRHVDVDGNYYTLFLGQFTIIEKLHLLNKKLKRIGFRVLKRIEVGNHMTFILIKP